MASQGQQLLRQCSRTAMSISRHSLRSSCRLQNIRPLQTAAGSTLADCSPRKTNEGIWNHSLFSLRTFSEASTQTKVEGGSSSSLNDDTAAEINVQSTVETNVLEGLADDYTPGQALLVLNLKRATVFPQEIVDLCKAARPGYSKDAKVIRTALREFKRTRDLLIDKNDASVAVSAMLQSMLPHENVTAQDKISAALYVLNVFNDTASGLYFATPMPALDEVFSVLLEGVQEQKLPRIVTEEEEEEKANAEEKMVKKRFIRKHLKKLGLMPRATPPKQKSTGEEEETDEVVSAKVAEATLLAVELLVIRKERPYRKMKRRAAKKYMQQIRIHHGPTPTTVQTTAKIVSQLRGPTVAMKEVVQRCLDARCPVPEEFIQEMEAAMQHEGEEATDASSEGDENVQDEEEEEAVTEDLQEEEDEVRDDGEEEEKKD